MATNRSERTVNESRYLASLSTLLFSSSPGNGYQVSRFKEVEGELRFVSALSEEQLDEYLALADAHHVTVRVAGIIQKTAPDLGYGEFPDRLQTPLSLEQRRIQNALRFLN